MSWSSAWGQRQRRTQTPSRSQASQRAPAPRTETSGSGQNPSQNQCFNGSPENMSLHQQVLRSDFASIINNTNMNPNRMMQNLDQIPACVSNVSSVGRGIERPTHVFADLTRYGESIRNQGRIKPECVAAAMSRGAVNPGYLCSSPADTNPRVITGNNNREGPCMSPEIVNHVTWVVNQALACVGAMDQPINPEIVLRKFNNETGFHFYRAYRGGVGMGQLTTSAARQVLSGNTPVFQRFRESQEPACQPFKRPVLDVERRLEANSAHRQQRGPATRSGGRSQAGRESAQRRPQAAPNPQAGTLEPENWCNLISSSNGLAANTMMSLLYFIHTRANIVESRIRPLLQSAQIDLAKQQRFIDLATLAAYGREGNNGTLNLVEPLRTALRQSRGNADVAWQRFSEVARGEVTYLQETENKSRELIDRIRPFNRITGRNFEANSTAECIEPPASQARR